MKNERNAKILIIIILLVAVIGLSIGLAAFSNTLTISSSANVDPVDAFSVVFSTQEKSTSTALSSSNYSTLGGATLTASNVSLTGTKISGLNASFTEPGQSVSYKFYVRNVGEYIAYLNSITGGNITCSPGSGTTASLVTEACKGITYNLSVTRQSDSIVMGVFYGDGATPSSGTASSYLVAGDYADVVISIGYSEGSVRADGPFSIAISDVTLLFESAD